MKALRAWWLRWRIREAKFCAKVVEADMLAAPTHLIKLRGLITDLSCELARLEK